MSEVKLTRRDFLKGLAAAGLVGVSATAAYASLLEPFNYELTETDIHIAGLPESFDGFRIAQLTDVHHSRLVSAEEVWRVVELARGARPHAPPRRSAQQLEHCHPARRRRAATRRRGRLGLGRARLRAGAPRPRP